MNITQHLINIGGASRDDLIVPKDIYKEYFNCNVDICEKVDGAQLGFSISENSTHSGDFVGLYHNKIQAQNRSHYVNSQSHSQFKILDKWIAKHLSDLFEILDAF